MEIVYLLLPAAIALATIGLCGFIWAVRKGQFEDLESPARRIIFDDEPDQQPQVGTKIESPQKKSQ